MTRKVRDFSAIREAFDAYIGGIVYATMTTVDAKGRPRARVLIPVWEMADIRSEARNVGPALVGGSGGSSPENGGGRPLGWLGTYPTPVKSAHLAANPHATFSYWSPRQNAVNVDTVAEWVDDDDVRRHVWDLYVKTSPPGAGYDPGQFWKGPLDPKFQVLRLEPWRVQVIRGTDLASTIWQPGPDGS